MKTRQALWIAAAAILVPAIGLATLLSDPTGFPLWRGGAYSDLLVSHWPIAAFIRESLTTWRQLPLWNPLILSGMPLTADPLAGFWYPPNLLGWLSTTGLGFNILFWTHLGLAACGVRSLLRSEGASQSAAWLGSVAFAATPKLIGHIGLGHLTLVEAVCWTPWILLAIRRAIEGGLKPEGRLWRYGVAGGLLGMLALIDPRWVIPASILSMAYAGKCIAHSQPSTGRIGRLRGLGGVLVCVGIAAPALIPALELLPLTTRSEMTPAVAEEISLEPGGLLGALIFDGGGPPETQAYLGATVLVLLAAGAAASMQRGRFWSLTLVVAVLLALGSATPMYGWLSRVLPGMSWLRVPARFYLIVGLAAAMLAGHGLDRLRAAVVQANTRRRVRLGTVGAGALLVGLAIMAYIVRLGSAGDGNRPQVWAPLVGGVLASAVAASILVLVSGARTARFAGPALIGLIAIDLGVADALTLRVEQAEAALATDACDLTGERVSFGQRRIFSPSYSLPQQALPLCQVELADGVNPLQLTSYRDVMAAATGFGADGYSVTLPPFEDGDVWVDWHPVLDLGALGLFNIERIVSAYPLGSPGLELLSQQEGQWIYRNPEARPRAWVEPLDGRGDEWRTVESVDWTPNRITVRAVGPGKLVLSEIAYPGWRARVDGLPAGSETYRGVLRSVELDGGPHEVVFVFVPASMAWGAGIGVLTLLGLLALKVLRR